MNQNFDWVEDFHEVVKEMTGEVIMLEMCLYCISIQPPFLRSFSEKDQRELINRLSSYLTQHVLDINILEKYLDLI